MAARTSPGQSEPRTAAAQKSDALSLLKRDHESVARLFELYAAAEDDAEEKLRLAEAICQELTVHATIEEEILYPKARDALEDDDEAEHLLDEADADHEAVKTLVGEIEEALEGDGVDDQTDARIKLLREQVTHHVEEEEGELFPKLKKSDLDLEALGEELSTRKEELEEEI